MLIPFAELVYMRQNVFYKGIEGAASGVATMSDLSLLDMSVVCLRDRT
jgi:hypothetical protein